MGDENGERGAPCFPNLIFPSSSIVLLNFVHLLFPHRINPILLFPDYKIHIQFILIPNCFDSPEKFNLEENGGFRAAGNSSDRKFARGLIPD